MNRTATSTGEPAHDGVQDGWQLLSASVPGRSHSSRGQGNDDAVNTAVLPCGTMLLALADGAGSARHGGAGAQLAVQRAVESLAEGLGTSEQPGMEKRARESGACAQSQSDDGDTGCSSQFLTSLLRTALQEVRRAVARRARHERVRPRQFACTLLLAIITGEELAVLQLGDGAAVIASGDGWQRITPAIRGRYAGETVFVTSRRASALAVVASQPLSGVRAVALLSDGLEPVAVDTTDDAPHAPFFEPLASFATSGKPRSELEAELARFLSSERVQNRSGDDLSLILAVSSA